MHHRLQHGKVRSQVINVPERLPELLSDITREVLRCQPTTGCLCQFIIDYLNSVIATQDKATIAKSITDQALRIVDGVIADMCICDIPKAKAEYMCEAMEECFRRFLSQRRCEKGKNKEIIIFNEFDMLDELMQKCKLNDDELKISKPLIEAAYQKFVNMYLIAKDSSQGTESLYQYFREREITRVEQRLKEDAAIKIQSLFRGYLLRKSLFVDKTNEGTIPTTLEPDADEMKEEVAAKKIQKFFRRHLSILKNSKVEKIGEMNSKDPFISTSGISLTARQPREQDSYDNEIQKKLIPDNKDNSVIKDGLDIENNAAIKDVIEENAVVEDEDIVKEDIAVAENESAIEDSPGIEGEHEKGPVAQNNSITEDIMVENLTITEDSIVSDL